MMNRDIKFRAWDDKNKQFADYEDIEECLSCQNRDGWKSSDGMGCCFGINAVEVLADCIIEQYTGVKDKNGKEIYEGDIVVYDGIGYEYYWDEMLQGFNVRRADGNQRLYGSASYEAVKFGSVVGNIHENPELLKG